MGTLTYVCLTLILCGALSTVSAYGEDDYGGGGGRGGRYAGGGGGGGEGGVTPAPYKRRQQKHRETSYGSDYVPSPPRGYGGGGDQGGYSERDGYGEGRNGGYGGQPDYDDYSGKRNKEHYEEPRGGYGGDEFGRESSPPRGGYKSEEYGPSMHPPPYGGYEPERRGSNSGYESERRGSNSGYEPERRGSNYDEYGPPKKHDEFGGFGKEEGFGPPKNRDEYSGYGPPKEEYGRYGEGGEAQYGHQSGGRGRGRGREDYYGGDNDGYFGGGGARRGEGDFMGGYGREAAAGDTTQHPEREAQHHHKPSYNGHGGGYETGNLQCYQCAYSPSKVTYKNVKIPLESYAPYSAGYNSGPKVRHETKRVAVTTDGGWDRCKGPFTHSQARKYGVDLWACHHNCYTRLDYNGNLFRGCYKGEYGVNPKRLGCHYQGGALYCFCKGTKCNNGPIPKHHPKRSH